MVAGPERVRDGLDASHAQIEQYPLGASYHEAGGLCMGATKDDGVVDRDGRFFGERRVVAVDASAWPVIGCANRHLSIVAIARRQAMLLAERLRAGGL
jgi:choline dehydrogenase-like flavoprotein